ncbi:MAG: hypothetical protein JWO85_2570 [Candidatus Eremiobacteraeota bacterium]|nr:hypothetical protein [Candidatus Eremiobacteraeota bacterium]
MKRGFFLSALGAIAATAAIPAPIRSAAAKRAPLLYTEAWPGFRVVGGTIYTFDAHATGAEPMLAYFDAQGRELLRVTRGAARAPRLAVEGRIGLDPSKHGSVSHPCVSLGSFSAYDGPVGYFPPPTTADEHAQYLAEGGLPNLIPDSDMTARTTYWSNVGSGGPSA